jgi:uncharacterized protein (TIGR00725 family)
MRKRQVAVIGSSDDTQNLDEAYSIGKFVARKGYTLITGGRGGIMKAASQGAYENNGIVIGILPGDDLEASNNYCTVVIPTGIGFARNAVNVLSADILVAIGGKSGTLSELAYAGIFSKPVICCTFASGWSAEFPAMKANGHNASLLLTASSVEEACSHLERFLNGHE